MNAINLGQYDSSVGKASMDDMVSHSSENLLTIEALSSKVNINKLSDNISLTIADKNILSDYKNFLLDNFCLYVELPEEFYYKPDYVSKKIYGTVDFWWLVLMMADVPSAYEFNSSPIAVFDPSKFSVINKIINNNYRKIANARENPEKIDDLILTKVKIKNDYYKYDINE